MGQIICTRKFESIVKLELSSSFYTANLSPMMFESIVKLELSSSGFFAIN